MFDRIRAFCASLLLATLAVFYAGSGVIAQDGVWRVSKSSGDVSVTPSGGEQTALIQGTVVNPGDSVRTGQNGRVLLMRGQETILISPNSVIGIPAEKKESLSTTIIQQAGSILLDVEKRNVKHFSVETPYLAAVVKGTQFRVTVGNTESRVDVLKGQVEVADFKSGQYALVRPDQAAKVSVQGPGGLALSGSGALSLIQQGTPRKSSVTPVALSKEVVPASDSRPKAEPVRVASAMGEVQAAATSWSAPPSKDSGWTSGFPSWSKGFLGSSGKGNSNEDYMLAAALSCAVGFVVAIAVGTQRRRKDKKLAKG